MYEKTRWWRWDFHKILPLSYDDSLSYYEFLCKMNKKMDEMIDIINTLEQAIEGAITEEDIEQTTGTSTTHVMSQKAVTDALANCLGDDDIEQTTGTATDKVMSQKAVTDALEDCGQEIIDSEEIVVSPIADKIQLYLKNTISTKIAKALTTPTVAPTSQKIVTIDTNNAQKLEDYNVLPTVTAADNGAFLRVVNGQWAKSTLINAREGDY